MCDIKAGNRAAPGEGQQIFARIHGDSASSACNVACDRVAIPPSQGGCVSGLWCPPITWSRLSLQLNGDGLSDDWLLTAQLENFAGSCGAVIAPGMRNSPTCPARSNTPNRSATGWWFAADATAENCVLRCSSALGRTAYQASRGPAHDGRLLRKDRRGACHRGRMFFQIAMEVVFDFDRNHGPKTGVDNDLKMVGQTS